MRPLDRILEFVFSHHLLMIEIIIGLIFATILVWLLANLRQEAFKDKSAEENLRDIEGALKRVLEGTSVPVTTAAQVASLIKDDDEMPQPKTAPAPAAARPAVAPPTAPAPAASPAPAAAQPAAAAAPAPAAASVAAAPAAAPAFPLNPPANPGIDPAEVAKLKGEIQSRESRLDDLEKALASAKDELHRAKNLAAGAGGNTDELQRRVKELEARLGEYEIIEDDIANLSLYKEENVRLKAELDKLRGQGSPETMATSQPAAASKPAPAAAPAAPGPGPTDKNIDPDKLLKEFDTMATPSAAGGAGPAPGTSEKAGETKDSGAKLIEEFENFMKGSNT